MRIIGKTSEWKRINALPLRQSYDEQGLVNYWTKGLQCFPFSQQNLNFHQALLIQETINNHGSIGCIGVGGGKSFVAPLIPIALGSQKPLLIVPASLKTQMIESVIPDHMKNNWLAHSNLRIESYNWISSIKGARFLEEYQPDLMICDEVHKLKNPKSARTKRIIRYFKTHPGTIFVGLSGTITKDALSDYYHLFWLALRDRSPLPNNQPEIEMWDLVLSPKRENNYFENIHPGVLLYWDPNDTRKGYQKRLSQTPGIVITENQACDSSINIHLWSTKHETPELVNCRETWILPNGEWICDALQFYQKSRQLSNGYYYDYAIQPPEEWIEKKRAWHSLARIIIKNSRKNIDTLGQLELYCGHDFREFVEWKEIEKTFKPQTLVYWYDTRVLSGVIKFINLQSDQRFLIWVDNVALGKMLESCGFLYYGDGDHQQLLHYSTRADIPNIPIVLSIDAHSEGKNLQKFNKNIIITPPNSGKRWEQIMGRTHRIGQESHEINSWVCCHTDELMGSFQNAMVEAEYIQTTTGQKQKLLMSTVTINEKII